MIKRFTDHSANERTYLAWVRTSIAIMAFGFLIEKFEIFMTYVGRSIGDEEHFQSALSAELVGLSLFLVGIIMIIASTMRFFMYNKAIDSDESIPYVVKNTNILLSVLVILMALFLFFYMGDQVLN